jgi:hypothetical protein
MEQARQSALAHHVHRAALLGKWVLINETWYNRLRKFAAEGLVLLTGGSGARGSVG